MKEGFALWCVRLLPADGYRQLMFEYSSGFLTDRRLLRDLCAAAGRGQRGRLGFCSQLSPIMVHRPES